MKKLYFKFCNERKKYPIELKRRQAMKRKRDYSSMNLLNHQPEI